MKRTVGKNSVEAVLLAYRPRIILLSCLMILESVFQVAMALLTRFVIDAALSGSPLFTMWAWLFVTDLVLQVGVYTLLAWYSGSTADRFSATLRQNLLRSAMYSKDSLLQEYHSGALLSRGMEDVHTVCDGAIHALPSLIGQAARLIGAFVAIILIYPKIAWILLLVAAVTAGMVTVLRPMLKKRHRRVRQAEEQVLATMQEDLQQLELIHSLNVQEQMLKGFQRRQRWSLKESFKRRIFWVGSNSILSVGSVLGAGVLLLWGVAKVAGGMLSYGSLTSMLQLVSQFRSPVLNLSGLWTRFAAVDVARERLDALLGVENESRQTEAVIPIAIIFDQVSFCYPGDDEMVLNNFSARFSLSGWSCLTGISGWGKSTLFKLMLGLYTPQSGSVYLETSQGNIVCSDATRHLFAYVPQDYALFSGTVLENLQLVAPDSTEEDRRQALQIAQADFVWEMTLEEQTPVGENNTGLSKGQLQRLAIARAVLMQRPVLLLDECTSALDAQTEQAVLEALHNHCPNAIVVTHSPEALESLKDITFVSTEI